ncbi:MAG: ATP-binding protein [Candidatus Omnitrophota bacterium]
MDKTLLKEIVLEQKEIIENVTLGVKREELEVVERYFKLPHSIIVSGIRRTGKSTLLSQIIQRHYKDKFYYLSFEDERLLNFSLADFNQLYEVFLEVFGEKKVFFFDEIQNVAEWELFVRRMQEREFKFFITGSNASLLSKELGTRLTGRYVMLELFPFSFREFLRFKNVSAQNDKLLTVKDRAVVKRFFNEYLKNGGMPEYLKYDDETMLKRVYEDILYRDIAARYEIKEIKALRELGLYFLSNIGTVFSYNNLKNVLGLGSGNTIKSYTEYLENSFLIFTINRFSYSLKQQFVANKKVYCIDNGLANAVAFQFSQNKGKFLENLVFMELKRRFDEIFYYKTQKNLEVDFCVRDEKRNIMLFQVAQNLASQKTREREIKSLLSAMEELKLSVGVILTEDEEEEIMVKRKKIVVKPVYKWLME